jgi:hypothetical protein
MRWRAALATTSVAVGGAVLAKLIHAPAAALMGSMAAVALYALLGRTVVLAESVRRAALFLLGLAIGAAATPETLRLIPHWPLSLVLLIAATALMSGVAYTIYRRLGGWDRPTALFASVPGALSTVLAVGEARGADMKRVAVAQSIRVVVLAGLAPVLMSGLGAAPAVHTITPTDPGVVWCGVALGGFLTALAAQRLRWPAPWLLGPFLLSLIVHGTGVAHATMPPLVLDGAYATLGVMAGARFAGTRVQDLVRIAPLAILALLGAGLVGVSVGALAGILAHTTAAAGILSFAPGGLEVMTALALALHIAPAYVAVHHLVRFVAVNLALPWISGRLAP